MMRILIYGAGVIGSLYAFLFSKAGYDTSLYARGERLSYLQEKGLTVKTDRGIQTVNIKVIPAVRESDRYDFIFLPVRENQLEGALTELRENSSPIIVTLVNTIQPYGKLELLCGRGRLLPAFPGAGGRIHEGVLDAKLTPGWIQPTTFGEINGQRTERVKALAGIFRNSKIPYQIVGNMQNWQISHLAMVVPLADAYYMSKESQKVYLDTETMRKTAQQMKRNFRWLAKGHRLSPAKFYLIMGLPDFLFVPILKAVYKSGFGDMFMYRHAMKAPEEMKILHNQLYSYMKQDKRAAV